MTQRIVIGAVAAVAWAGLIIQLFASVEATGSLSMAVWQMLLYFTITTNLGVACFFTGWALSPARFQRPRLLAGLTLSILLVGIVNALLLRGLLHLTGAAWVADQILHIATPVLVAAFWFVLAQKGSLRWHDPLIWGLYPLIYLVYALIRGAADGFYAYPFIDWPQLGWRPVVVNAIAIAVGFIAGGYGLVWLDRRLGVSRSGWRPE